MVVHSGLLDELEHPASVDVVAMLQVVDILMKGSLVIHAGKRSELQLIGGFDDFRGIEDSVCIELGAFPTDREGDVQPSPRADQPGEF